jgi:hypothetical protein
VEYAWKDRGPATSLTATAAARELVAAYQAVTGKPPSLPLAELNLAHQWLETKGTKAMWRYDWGNLSAGGFVNGEEKLSWKGDVWRPPWFEPGEGADARTLDLHEKMLAGTAPSAFRGYQSHAEGAEGYVRLLLRPGFAKLLQAGAQGSPRAYAQAVVDTGYCRDRGCQPDQMGPALTKVVAQFRRDGVFKTLGLSRPSSGSSSGAVVLVGLVLWSEFQRKHS